MKVVEATHDSISVSWSQAFEMKCVSGYKVSISDETKRFVREIDVTSYTYEYTFTDLNQCSHYYITVEPTTISKSHQTEPRQVEVYTTINSK